MIEFFLGTLIGAALAIGCVVIIAVIGVVGWISRGSH